MSPGTLKNFRRIVRTCAWRKLAGRWDSDLDTADEIERIYAARTLERQVDL